MVLSRLLHPLDPLAAFAADGPPDLTDPQDVAVPMAPITSALVRGATDPVGGNGDHAMLANLARSAFGVSGAGVKVGILSNSFNLLGGYAADVASGALPAGVQVLQEGPSGGTDEGRAMAELVHQVAPGAQIAFASAFQSEAGFAAGITALAAAGCTVIVDDVTYLDEPFFQSGSAIDQAIAGAIADGVSYFTAASNEGTSFYQHAFTGVAAALPGVSGSYQAMNFGTATQPNTLQSLTIAAGAAVTIDLQWDQPFASIGGGPGSADSLGMILYNASGQIVASAIANRTGGDPVQILRFDNTTGATAFHLAIVANGGSAPPNLLKYIVYGQGVTINDGNAGIGSGTVTGHEEHPGVNSVGAIAAANAPANGGNGQIESYSSVGPGTLLFDAHGNRLTDAVSGHMVDFVAPDGVATSVFAPFYGTSAAAPDAAAVAALMLQADPGLTPAQVTAMLEASAVAVKGPAGGTGAGLIQATTAVQLALAAKAATSARPGGAVTAAVAGTTTAWSTVAAEPVKQAIAALAGGRSGAADFALRIDPAAVAPAWQNTTATAFAAVYTGHGAEVYAVPDPPAHPLA